MKELSDDLTRAIKSIVEKCRDEDKTVRYRQMRNYKKLKYYFDGITHIYDGGIAHDWRVWDSQMLSGASDSADGMFYDKNVNIFKAFLEAIIAALSVTTPTVIAYPDDATNVEDLATQKAANKIYDLIKKHNDISLLWIHSLFIYCTEGVTWAYNYTDCDEKYGTYDVNEYEDTSQDVQTKICSICKTNLVNDQFTDQLMNEFDPDKDEVEIQSLLDQGKLICPQCAQLVDPELKTEQVVVQRIVGKTSEPKSRECIEVYGGLNVKTPIYARKQCEMPYLILADEINVWYAMELFPDLKDKYNINQKLQPGSPEYIDFWMRTSTQYLGMMPDNVVTRERVWLRPMSFNQLSDDKIIKKLRDLFPFGCKATLINDECVEVEAEDLDDHWTPTVNPNADFLQFDPLGNTITSIQDITRDLVSLTLQTIEHGIPQTFANPSVIDFKAYQQMETKPGMIYPAKSATGKPLTDDILTLKTASLGAEVLPFAEQMLEMGQMTSGALPSIYGGAADNSSKTAAQYSMSRSNALQRLKTAWVMTSFWWKNIFGKVIPAYIKCIQESGDERYVVKNEAGDFINVEIRRSELYGKLGSIELESSEELPATWSQKKEVVMMLLQSPNPMILDALTQPMNLPVLRDAIGLSDFKLPGEDDREKQLDEIRILLQTEPITDPQSGQEVPSVDIEPQVDNNSLEAEVCKEFLKSDEGRLAKIENPAGYRNILLHMQRHQNAGRALAAMQNTPPSLNGPSNGPQNSQQVPQSNPQIQKVQPMIGKGTPNEQPQPVAVN